LVDAVTIALPSPLLPPLPPSLYIPPLVDRRDDIPELERPPRKRSCLFALGPRYEVGESSTTRPTGGRGVDYGFVSVVDAEERRRGIREVGYGIRDTWVDPTEAVLEIAPMTMGEDSSSRDHTDCGGGGLCFLRGLGSCDRRLSPKCSRLRWQSFERLTVNAELLALRGQQRARQPGPDVRVLDHQDASRDADSHI
ncbi:hypothetical protein Tco_1322948, partial [Tanacetum coccineum]